MARISVTTDQGEVVLHVADILEEYGDVTQPLPKALLNADLAEAIVLATERDTQTSR